MLRLSVLLLVCCGLATVQSQVLTGVSSTVPLQKTDWLQTLSVSKFDGAAGDLIRAEVRLRVDWFGSIKVESTDAAAAVIPVGFDVLVTGQLPNQPQLTMMQEHVQRIFNAAAFDGTLDYSGASGVIFSNLTVFKEQSYSVVLPSDLQLFIGSGSSIDVSVRVKVTHDCSGPGNAVMWYESLASASLNINYYSVTPSIALDKTVNGPMADDSHLLGSNAAICPGVKSLMSGVITDDIVTYCFAVTNTGNVNLASIAITDAQLGITGSNLRLLSGSLPLLPGASLMYAYSYSHSTAGSITNTATVTGVPVNSNGIALVGVRRPTATSSASIAIVEAPIVSPTISIEKSPDQVVALGGHARFTITVTNTGQAGEDLVQVAVVDALYPVCNKAIGRLAAGASSSYECTAAVTQLSDFINTATVTGVLSPDACPRRGQNCADMLTASDDASVTVRRQSIAIVKSIANLTPQEALVSPPRLTVGRPVQFKYTVTNNGELDLVDVTVTDSDTSLRVQCPQSSLSAGASMDCTCGSIVQLGQYTNTATVVGHVAIERSLTVTAQSSSGYTGVPAAIGQCPALTFTDRVLAVGSGAYEVSFRPTALTAQSTIRSVYPNAFQAGASSPNLEWVDLHYRINNGPLVNVRMLEEADWMHTFSVHMERGDRLTYTFTYCVSMIDCDTAETVFTAI